MDDVMDAIEYFSKYWNKRFEEEYQQVQKFRRQCAELTDTLVDAKKTIERMQTYLRVLRTWAKLDLDEGPCKLGTPPLLDPRDVMRLCDKGLGYEPDDGDD